MRKNHFTIVILAYNCEKWAEKCFKSAASQEYDNYSIVYVNDASTDNTRQVIKELDEVWSKNRQLGKNIVVRHNNVNVKALENLYSCVDTAAPESIIVALDGDDWLSNKGVLKHLNEIYQDPNVWITAGSYIESVGGRVVRPVVTDDYWIGNIRRKPWTFSHLRTFRKELFLSINRDDMLDTDGGFYKFTWDRVIMYPMIEMAGPKHFRAINRVNYVYNRENPLAVDRVHRDDQLRIEADLVGKPPYKRLEELPTSDYL